MSEPERMAVEHLIRDLLEFAAESGPQGRYSLDVNDARAILDVIHAGRTNDAYDEIAHLTRDRDEWRATAYEWRATAYEMIAKQRADVAASERAAMLAAWRECAREAFYTGLIDADQRRELDDANPWGESHE